MLRRLSRKDRRADRLVRLLLELDAGKAPRPAPARAGARSSLRIARG